MEADLAASTALDMMMFAEWRWQQWMRASAGREGGTGRIMGETLRGVFVGKGLAQSEDPCWRFGVYSSLEISCQHSFSCLLRGCFLLLALAHVASNALPPVKSALRTYAACYPGLRGTFRQRTYSEAPFLFLSFCPAEPTKNPPRFPAPQRSNDKMGIFPGIRNIDNVVFQCQLGQRIGTRKDGRLWGPS